MNRSVKNPEEYLTQPYSRILIPDEKSGTFAAEILEFPGCVSQGDTAQEAYERLEEAAKGWIEAALDLGQEIPPPGLVHGYSGKFALRLPKSLHRQAVRAAERDGTSLNQFIVTALAEKIGATTLYDHLTRRFQQQVVAITVDQGWQAYSTMETKPSASTLGEASVSLNPRLPIQEVKYDA